MEVNVVLSSQGIAKDGRCLACRNGFLKKNRFATLDGCAFGVGADDKPAMKPWRFVSSSFRLVQELAARICAHTTHEPLQGEWTRMSAFYLRKNDLLNSLLTYLGASELEEQPSCFDFPCAQCLDW